MKKLFAVVCILYTLFILFSTEKDSPIELNKSKEIRLKKEKYSTMENFEEKEVKQTFLKNKDQNQNLSNIRFTIGQDINVLKENNLTITASLEDNNSENNNSKILTYAYLWKVDGNLISTTKSLTTNFSLGEHNVSCTLMEKSNYTKITERHIKVTAWAYKKENHLFYGKSEDEITFFFYNIYDHKNNLLVEVEMEKKILSFYNSQNQKIERLVEYETYPMRNTQTLYTYANNGMISTIEEYNYQNEFSSRQTTLYNENNEMIDYIFEYSEQEENHKPTSYEILYVGSSDPSNETSTNISRHDEQKRLIYQKNTHDGQTQIQEYSYNEKGQKEEERETLIDEKGSVHKNIYTFTFNEQGEKVKREEKRLENEILTCHQAREVHYQPNHYQLKSIDIEVFDGTCGYEQQDVGKIHKEYIYDSKGKYIETKVTSYDGDEIDETRSTAKVITTYSNELE